jgi:hypothetical protein
VPPTIKEPNRPTCSVQSGANALKVPSNISLLQLPPRAPELNGQENNLAIHAAELAVEPNFQILRRHRQSLLLRLEYAYRSAVENHVHRAPRLDTRRSLNLRIGISPTVATSSLDISTLLLRRGYFQRSIVAMKPPSAHRHRTDPSPTRYDPSRASWVQSSTGTGD